MNKKVQILFIALTMLLLMVTPTMAGLPTTGTYTEVTVLVGVNPGKQFMTGDILHIKGSISAVYHHGGPWGECITAQSEANTVELNTVSITGRAILQTLDVFTAGTLEGIANTKIIGAGPYHYLGPTFTFTVGGRTETVTHGALYIGALIEGFVVKHGVSGDLKGAVIKATFTGVNINFGPLAGVHLLEGTGTYKLKG